MFPDPVVHDFQGIQRNFDWLTKHIEWIRGAPDATVPGQLGKIVIDETTGDLYSKKITGWEPI